MKELKFYGTKKTFEIIKAALFLYEKEFENHTVSTLIPMEHYKSLRSLSEDAIEIRTQVQNLLGHYKDEQ
jgi:hypothetical protein